MQRFRKLSFATFLCYLFFHFCWCILMDVLPVRQNTEYQTDRHPLLMDRAANFNRHELVIDIPLEPVASVSCSHRDEHFQSNELHHEDSPSTSTPTPAFRAFSASPNVSNFRNSSLTRRGDNYACRNRSPLNSGLWISVELVVNASQIIAAIIDIFLSRHEHPKSPLFTWIIGYTIGCIATLPLLYWCYIHRNSQFSEQESARPNQTVSQANHSDSSSNTAISITSDQESSQGNAAVSQAGQAIVAFDQRIHALVDHFKMVLDCFFAVWFVVGNVWLFGGHSSASDAPNLYKLCILFLIFSCIGYALPFILCAMICCCLPCIISIMGFREIMGQNRAASSESIVALPTYKFKAKRRQNREDIEINTESRDDGGIVAAGTDKERIISAEDAACCICLAKYMDNDELRELPCSHFFHTDCVDKWLKINASCPLCKAEVGNAKAS